MEEARKPDILFTSENCLPSLFSSWDFPHTPQPQPCLPEEALGSGAEVGQVETSGRPEACSPLL